MLEKLKKIELRLEDVQRQLSDSAVYADPVKLAKLSREQKELGPVVRMYHDYLQAEADYVCALDMLSDPEMRELAQEELSQAKAEKVRLQEELKLQLLPRDPDDDRSAVLEIRAGVGGEEGALFAADLLRMYQMYAQKKGFSLDVINANETELGGMKEAVCTVEGTGVWARLKFEAGTHCVKRVPETESGGRIHTSTATVAVMPQAEEVECVIDPKDLQIDTYRSSGAGGQHVNKTESAIRITHLPSGTVVECQDERSQYKNKDRAMKILRTRLYEAEKARKDADYAAKRRFQVGNAERSEKIRTYRFQEKIVVDHRLSGESRSFPVLAVLDGDLDGIVDALIMQEQAAMLQKGKENI